MGTLNANAPKGVFNNPFGDKMELNENAINIEPWGFYMLTKK